ncbi:MAG: type II secretion system F family protein [Magnetococcales bacterium]|nr:type II secretion system F family protein [Magnetococcales bacterium]
MDRLEGEEARRKGGTPGFRRFFSGRYVPPIRERIVFTRQMAALLAAGFPVIETLKGVEEQIEAGPFRTVITRIRNDVGEGQSLSEAMGRFPRIFPPVTTSLVRAGEQGGALDVVFERLARVMEQQRRVQGRLISALIYPAIMATVGGLILVFMMSVVVPRVVVVFADSHQSLPWITRSLLALSRFIREWGVLALLGFLTGMGGFLYWARSSSGRPQVERVLLRLPVLGSFLLHVLALRVCQLMGLLLTSGVPIIASLKVTAEATGFVIVREDLLRTARAVEQGDSLAAGLAQSGRFPLLALRMIQAGERAGNLEEMLDRVAGLYQEEIERLSERVMHLVEPVIILTMGVVVAYVVVAVLLPIFEMNQLIR